MGNDVCAALSGFVAETLTDPDLVSAVHPGVDEQVIRDAWPTGVPNELDRLWRCCSSAVLHEDVAFGQWGLRLLAPHEARARTVEYLRTRRRDARDGDIVFGEFLGDSDLVVHSGDGRGVIVADPLDGRVDWPEVAATVAEFLDRFRLSPGAKYWEPRG